MASFSQLAILQRWAIHTFRYADVSYRKILNEQTGGTLISRGRMTPGSYYQDVYWGNDPDIVVLDDPSDNSTVTNSELKQVSQFDVKVAARAKPYEWQSIAFKWQGTTPESAAQAWARTVAESMLKIRVSALTSALVACFSKGISTNGATVGGSGADTELAKVVKDDSGTTESDNNKLDLAKLISARGQFGDLYGLITGVIMHSGAFFGMQDRNIKTYQELFMYPGTFVTMTADGLPIYVTDNPILTITDSNVVKYRTLLLRPMAACLFDHSDFEAHIDRTNGTKWINTTAQAQQTFSLFIKGLTWKTRSAIHPGFAAAKSSTKLLTGVGTTANAIDTPASWDRVGTSESKALTAKEMPGVMLISQ